MNSRITIELSDILAQLPTWNHMQMANFDRIASDLSRVRTLNCWLAQLRCSAAAGLERLQVIYSVNGKLATAAGALTAEMISQRGLCGVTTLVISEHKVPDSVELEQVHAGDTRIPHGEVAVSVVHSL